jgi:hypothetical protein
MLIDNPSYIHKFDELNHIALDCIKKVLEQRFQSEEIKQAEEKYKYFYGITMEQNI